MVAFVLLLQHRSPNVNASEAATSGDDEKIEGDSFVWDNSYEEGIAFLGVEK